MASSWALDGTRSTWKHQTNRRGNACQASYASKTHRQRLCCHFPLCTVNRYLYWAADRTLMNFRAVMNPPFLTMDCEALDLDDQPLKSKLPFCKLPCCKAHRVPCQGEGAQLTPLHAGIH